MSDFQKARMGDSFILFRLLELLLVRVKIVFELIAPDLQPKTIRLLTEIEGPFPTTYHELHRSFATRFPNTWNKARPQIAWIPLGIRLTEFGAKGNAEIHAARSVSSADVDPVRSLYFLPASVSFRMEKDDGTSDRFRSSRVAYELLAIKSKCSDVQPLATAHSNTVLSILYDGKPPFEPYHLSPDSDDAAKIADASMQKESFPTGDAPCSMARKPKKRRNYTRNAQQRIRDHWSEIERRGDQELIGRYLTASETEVAKLFKVSRTTFRKSDFAKEREDKAINWRIKNGKPPRYKSEF